MESLLHNFFTDPLFYIGLVISIFAVFGFLTFLRGIIAGIGHVLGNSGHAEHQEEAQVRVVWGTLMLWAAFLTWEIIRWVGSWFGYAEVSTSLGLTVTSLALLWIVVQAFLQKKKKGGH
jgi:hypothetical protein